MPEMKSYTVTGSILSIFKPYRGYNGSEPFTNDIQEHSIAGLDVQVWHKGPLVITHLGSGTTESDGSFSITFSNDSVYEDPGGEITNVFLRIYYQGVLIAGDTEALDSEIFNAISTPVTPEP